MRSFGMLNRLQVAAIWHRQLTLERNLGVATECVLLEASTSLATDHASSSLMAELQ